MKNFLALHRLLHLNTTGPTKNIVFKLKPETDMGFKNLLFIFSICIAILIGVVCCTFFIVGGCQFSCPCAKWFSKNSSYGSSNRQYKFSLLSRKSKRPELFEDEFDDDETEDILVKEFFPKSKIKEYHDDDVDEHNMVDYSDEEDGSEEDVVLVRTSNR